MSLRWRAFEQRLHRRVRAELRGSERLREDYRQFRKSRYRNLHLPGWSWRLIFLFYGLSIVFSRAPSHEFLIAFLTLWTLAACFLRANLLCHALYYSPALGIFNHFPVSDDRIFQTQWRGFVRHSLWSAVDFALIYGVLAWQVGVRPNWVVVGPAFGLVQWLFVVAGAMMLVAFGVRRLLYLPAILFGALAVGLFALGPAQEPVVNWLNHLAYWVPPLGWVLYGLGISGDSRASILWPCLLSGMILALLPAAYRRLRRSYVLDEQTFAAVHRLAATRSLDETEAQAPAQGPAEAAEVIQSGEFLAGLDWEKLGLLERLVAHLLGPRERVVAEFLVAGKPNWTAGLRGLVIFLALGTLACLVFPLLQSGAVWFIVICAAIFIISNMAGNWRGFAMPYGAGRQSPFFAVCPIAFGQLVRVVLTVNLVRFLAGLPFLAGAGAILTLRSHWDTMTAAGIGLKALTLGLLLQPLALIISISPGTNDSRKPLLIFSAVIVSLLYIGCGIPFFISSNVHIVVLAGLGVGVLSVAALLLYGGMFNRGCFDLVPLETVENRAPD